MLHFSSPLLSSPLLSSPLLSQQQQGVCWQGGCGCSWLWCDVTRPSSLSFSLVCDSMKPPSTYISFSHRISSFLSPVWGGKKTKKPFLCPDCLSVCLLGVCRPIWRSVCVCVCVCVCVYLLPVSSLAVFFFFFNSAEHETHKFSWLTQYMTAWWIRDNSC